MFSLTAAHRQIVVTALVAFLAALLFVSPTQASGPARLELRSQNVLGVVPALGSSLAQETQTPQNSAGNLDYHGGRVIHSNTVYLIFWIPSGYSVSANYRKLIKGYFRNVAYASGLKSNVYYSDTQYNDYLGYPLYKVTFGGSVLDTHSFPVSGCTDPYTSICLTDAQIQNEIKVMMQSQLWTGGLGKIYFMFTPNGVGSCAGGACAYSDYCAYHSWFFNSAGKPIIYANQPYAAHANCGLGSVPQPNGDDADLTINVTSHEHNEAITDPLGTGWWNSNTGYENGDNCAWNFGTALGTTTYGAYNQAIYTGKYYLQQEWSNKSTACVLHGR